MAEGDEFLRRRGVNTLNQDEVSELLVDHFPSFVFQLNDACFERFIFTDGKNINALRGELAEWLRLNRPDDRALEGKYLNPLNRKLALLGLNVARDFKVQRNDRLTRLDALLLK